MNAINSRALPVLIVLHVLEVSLLPPALTRTPEIFVNVQREVASVGGPGAYGDLHPHLAEVFPAHPEATVVAASLPDSSLKHQQVPGVPRIKNTTTKSTKKQKCGNQERTASLHIAAGAWYLLHVSTALAILIVLSLDLTCNGLLAF